ncbi:phosphatase PAP2 family protein [Bradyrhizobium betae]
MSQAIIPKSYRIRDELFGECSVNDEQISIRANAGIRRVIQDFGLDPLYASYVMFFVHSAIFKFASAGKLNQELLLFSDRATRHALRNFDELPQSCGYIGASNGDADDLASSIISAVEKQIPHPPFMSSPASRTEPLVVSPWKSIENRPALRPDWGDRQPLNKNPLDISLRAPPEVFSEQFNRDLAEVRWLNEHPTDRTREIALFWNDSIGSTTPVGHWNAILCDILLDNGVNPLRSLELLSQLNKMLYVSGLFGWKYKFQYMYPRPIQFFDVKKTIVKTPNFPSYPSGHSCLSAAASYFIGSHFNDLREQMNTLANEASESRIMGGIHFRFDCEGGFLLGESVAKQLLTG